MSILDYGNSHIVNINGNYETAKQIRNAVCNHFGKDYCKEYVRTDDLHFQFYILCNKPLVQSVKSFMDGWIYKFKS